MFSYKSCSLFECFFHIVLYGMTNSSHFLKSFYRLNNKAYLNYFAFQQKVLWWFRSSVTSSGKVLLDFCPTLGPSQGGQGNTLILSLHTHSGMFIKASEVSFKNRNLQSINSLCSLEHTAKVEWINLKCRPSAVPRIWHSCYFISSKHKISGSIN